jgi:hypothetical protein
MRKKMLVPLLLVLETGMAQAPKQSTTLTINGYAGNAPLVQIGGKSYVEVEALARLTGGSVKFQPNRITLTLPASTPDAAVPQPEKKGFSPDFLKAAIEEMAAIREWRVAIMSLIQHGYPVTEDWVGGYRRTADSRLALVSAAAATDSDRNCMPLVTNEFGRMQQFSDKYLAMSKSMTYTSSDSVENDPQGQQILSCARGLESFPAGSQFQDVATCH